MPSSVAHRVADRFQARNATLIYRDTERDFYWGWFTGDVPARMHLTVINQDLPGCVVWLEDRGVRIFSARACQSGSARPLVRFVENHREEIEARWLKFMDDKGWLGVRVERERPVLVCYPGMETEFTRPTLTAVWTDRELRSR